MGYFKKKREKKKAQERGTILGYIDTHASMLSAEMTERYNQVLHRADTKRYDYENNIRENIANALTSDDLREALIAEIAGIIEEGMELYTFRLAKSKREQLAEQILHELAIKK